MKKNCIFIFILLFWGLAVCTILSVKIEEQMTAQVILCKVEDSNDENKSDLHNVKLPIDALFYDEDDVEHLYEVIEGDGWNTGKRVGEIVPNEYRNEKDYIIIKRTDVDYIRYASKDIIPGQRIRPTAFSAGSVDEYLILKDKEFSEIITMESQNPYMEEPVRESLELLEEYSIYYLNDVRSFLRSFPILSVILTILLSSIILWLYSWRCAKDLKENKIKLTMNAGIVIGLFWVFKQLVQNIQLPTSLLPAINIFDFKYYKTEFSVIFRGLNMLDGIVCTEIRELYLRSVIFSGIIFIGGILLCFAWIKVSRSDKVQIIRKSE